MKICININEHDIKYALYGGLTAELHRLYGKINTAEEVEISNKYIFTPKEGKELPMEKL